MSTKAAVPKKSTKKSVKHDKPSKAASAQATGAVLTILNKAAALKTALGQDSLERKKLSVLTGIQGKSTIANALTKMKNNGWMEVTPESVTITDAGVQAADPDAIAQAMQSIPTTNAEYHQSVKDQFKLKPKAIEIFDYIQNGATYEKKDVADALGLKMNSTFANLLTSLKKHNMIQFDRTTVRLTDEMLPFQPRAS